MKNNIFLFFIFFCTCVFSKEIKPLAEKLSQGIDKNLKVAVIDFTYADLRKSEGPVVIRERLTTELAGRQFTLIERALIQKVFEELNLQNSAVIEPQKASELGKILGADVLIIGTLNDISNEETEINARAVESQTGKILKAASIRIHKTWKDSITSPTNSSYLGKSLIQISLLLDTSSSMDGLINQAKNYLWKVVNELASSYKEGDTSVVEVALYEYGNNAIPAEKGYIRQVVDFTSDLDNVYRELFALKTMGGQEYCGMAVKEAVLNPKWSPKDDVYKAIFIAGNEPYTQGNVSFEESAALAKNKGIFVNTIFCGSWQQGVAMQWKKAAEMAGGEYANIDQNAQFTDILAPQDRKISSALARLNETYIPYGQKGKERLEFKKDMDTKIQENSTGIAYERAAYSTTKSASHALSQWDLISAIETGLIKRSEIKKEELPEDLSKMTDEELNDYIEQKLKERQDIKRDILRLKKERDEFIRKQRDSQKENTLDKKIIEIAKKQAALKGYKFK